MDGYEPVFVLAGATMVMAGGLLIYILGAAIHGWISGTGRGAHPVRTEVPRRHVGRETPWRPVWHRKAS